MKSMTGYGRSELTFEGKVYTCEIRSLNHRFLDISMRIPRSYANIESWIKGIIGKNISRGKVDFTLVVNGQADAAEKKVLEVDKEVLNHYHTLLMEVKKELGIKEKVRLRDILEFKDIFTVQEKEVELEKEKAPLKRVIENSLSLLVKMRTNEGSMLKADFIKRIRKIRAILREIQILSKNIPGQYSIKLMERIKELTSGIQVDKYRIEQEVAIFAEKCNITEEIIRFSSHLKQLEHFCKSGETIGKKIDFILQECGREANTIASKSSSSDISHCIVEIKSLIEEMREQANNIE